MIRFDVVPTLHFVTSSPRTARRRTQGSNPLELPTRNALLQPVFTPSNGLPSGVRQIGIPRARSASNAVLTSGGTINHGLPGVASKAMLLDEVVHFLTPSRWCDTTATTSEARPFRDRLAVMTDGYTAA